MYVKLKREVKGEAKHKIERQPSHCTDPLWSPNEMTITVIGYIIIKRR